MFHSKNFLEFHKKKNTKLKKYALDTKNRLQWIEKKEQQKKEQMEKQRMMLLRENDMGGYLHLLKQEKNI
jgi:hypothetical protein